MIARLAACAAAFFLVAAAPGPDAVAFGSREMIRQAALSPDGKSVVVVVPAGDRGSAALVINLTGSQKMTPVVSTNGNPERIQSCNWASNTRLVCSIYWVSYINSVLNSASRLVTVKSDGSDLKLLSRKDNSSQLWYNNVGGWIVDYQSDDGKPDTVLVAQNYVPEATVGTILGSRRKGLGVDAVDIDTMRSRNDIPPNDSAFTYISDGHGHVRIMGVQASDSSGNAENELSYFYRPKEGGRWKPLTTVKMTPEGKAAGFTPVAVDPDLNVAYGFLPLDGRQALFKMALDGSGTVTLVYKNPLVDVDDLIQVGRHQRVVGVSYVVNKRTADYFDPELKKLSLSLAKALPGLPQVAIVSASEDESILLLWAGSDDDPGRYFIYNKANHSLGQLLPVRPKLKGHKLAKVIPVEYPAADGTMIPAYLTLPPNGVKKDLPAIVMPHGGPGARDEWGFDWLSQFFAARGYAVLQPNFRGSTGYGDSWFQSNGFRSWRTAIGDVDDAGRWLVKQGIARKDGLAIVGWSYGGYAALQSGVTDPGLYKAIVAIAPVTDLDRLREDARPFSSFKIVDNFIGHGPHVASGSPARHADRFVAPVLMFHGDRDINVDIGESRLMRDRLKSAGKPVDLVEFDGLDHQLSDSKVRAEMLDRIDRFLSANIAK